MTTAPFMPPGFPPGPQPGLQAGPQPGPLSPEHYVQFEAAQARGAKVRKIARVATFGGWLGAVFAASALLFGLLGSLMDQSLDVVSVGLGLALGIVAFNEFRGAAMVRKLDVRATTLLGFNQLFLLASITVYCLWNMFWSPTVTGQSSGNAEVDEMLAGYSGLEQTVKLGLYGAVIVGTLLAQGLTAMYYFGRSRTLREYIKQTPPWIVALQRRTF